MGIIKDLSYLKRVASAAFNSLPSKQLKRNGIRNFGNSMFRRGETYGMRKAVMYHPAAEGGVMRNDWTTQVKSATSIIREEFKTICARAELAYRTDAIARRAVNLLANFIVGQGLKPIPAIKMANGDYVDGANKQLADDWERFNDECMRAGNGITTFYEAELIECITMIVYGSVITNVVRSKPGSLLPYGFQILKPTRLDFSKDTYVNSTFNEVTTGEIIHGLKLDNYGNVSAVYFQGEEKGRSSEWVDVSFVPIESEQYLGLSWLTPVLPAIFDRQQLISDKLRQSRIGAKLGFQLPREVAAGLDALKSSDDLGNEYFDLDFQGFVGTDKDIKPVTITDPIEKSFEALIRMTVQEIAIGVGNGISYQRTTTDLKDANFTSGRINTILDDKLVKVLVKRYCDCHLQKKYNRFVQWEVESGRLIKYGVGPSQYYSDPWYYNQCYWLPKDAEAWVDPLKDMQAQELEYKTGSLTLEEICNRKGKNWRSVLQQKAKEREYIKSLGLDHLLEENIGQKTEQIKDTVNAEGEEQNNSI